MATNKSNLPVAKTSKSSDIIKPSVVFADGKKHPMIELYDAGFTPILEAVGLAKMPDGRFTAYRIKFEGDKIIEITPDEPMQHMYAYPGAGVHLEELFGDVTRYE